MNSILLSVIYLTRK